MQVEQPSNKASPEREASQLDAVLRKALATPPISNEDILKRSKESRSKS